MINKSIIKDLISLSFESEVKNIMSDDVCKQMSLLLKDYPQESTRFIFNDSSEFHAEVISKILNKKFSKSISTINMLGKEYFCKGILGTNICFIHFYDRFDRSVVMINANLLRELIK